MESIFGIEPENVVDIVMDKLKKLKVPFYVRFLGGIYIKRIVKLVFNGIESFSNTRAIEDEELGDKSKSQVPQSKDDMIEEIARWANDRLNIPFLSEDTEQRFFVFIIRMVLDIINELTENDLEEKAA